MITIDEVKKILSEKGIKPTYPRVRIYQILSENEDHPTVDNIFKEIRKDIPTASRTTVYNTLAGFVEAGIADEILITGSEARYEIKRKNHHHFLCKKCGRIFDINVRCPLAEGKYAKVRGHLIQEIHGYFKGICKDCQKSEESE
ncbi:MAG: transcriptional repressor [Candidatus Marinimicrobia bacterium]|nr:transcriptional repressor [Candidatus Neomarinimicrobiota bacterium]